MIVEDDPATAAILKNRLQVAGYSAETVDDGREGLNRALAGSFDIVTCLEMLEHVPRPSEVVTALARLVRPGGHVICSTINRGPKAFALAIVGAEYLLRLLPRGTHDYARFIKPSELVRYARGAGLELADLAGIEYDPFSRKARITADTSVNYLAHFARPAVP